MCHALIVFRLTSIGLSVVESIFSSHRHFLSHQQRGFLQATLQLTKVTIFSNKHWAWWVHFQLKENSIELVNESESKEECHCFDWSWNFNTDVSKIFFYLAVDYPVEFAPEWICQTLHVMREKCQMFINVMHAVKRRSWICHFRFRYKCIYLIKYLLTAIGRSARRVFCPLSLHRPRRSASVCTKTSGKISPVQTSRSVRRLEIRILQMFPRPGIKRDYPEGEKDILLWQ